MTVLVLRGDARSLPLPDASVDLIVTSPPYFGLRSYTDGGEHYDGQIGSEATPAEYVAALVECTREWVRALKPSGSLFVNLGDKYGGADTSGGTSMSTLAGASNGRPRGMREGTFDRGVGRTPGRHKSLLGLPWRYALACIGGGSQLSNPRIVKALMRDYAEGRMTLIEAEAMIDYLAATPDAGLGLILRAEIIWAKPNGLPESVTDRVRRAHEQVFHFTRQPRYYSAVDEIREAPTGGTHARRKDGQMSPKEQATVDAGHRRGFFPEDRENPLGKLPGSVWDIPSQPLTVPGHLGVDHFAAFPMELPRRIIAGWSPPGVCAACGEGRRPVVDVGETSWARRRAGGDPVRYGPDAVPRRNGHSFADAQDRAAGGLGKVADRAITGYACACPQPDAPVRPAIILDPFGGTGTTALLARALGRHGITIDRSQDYCRLAAWRTSDPGERARAMQVPKPPPVPEGMDALFDIHATAGE